MVKWTIFVAFWTGKLKEMLWDTRVFHFWLTQFGTLKNINRQTRQIIMTSSLFCFFKFYFLFSGPLKYSISKELGQTAPTYLCLYLSRIFWYLFWRLKIANSSQTAQRAQCATASPSSLSHQWRWLTRPTIIKPGLWPSSKLLFGDKSILQSQADGHLAHCNRPLSFVSLWRSPPTDVEPDQTCWLTRTASQTKLRDGSRPSSTPTLHSGILSTLFPLKYGLQITITI